MKLSLTITLVIAFTLGLLLGWLIWEDNNVTPITKPDCELRKGYYTVIHITNSGISECGLVKKMYAQPQDKED